MHGNGYTASSALRITGETGLALALALVLHRDALAVRCTGEVNASFGTAVKAVQWVCLAGRQRRALVVSGALLFTGNAFLILVADVAVIALTVGLMFHGYTVSTVLAAGKLTGVEALLDAVILRLADVRLITAVAILFAFIALLSVPTAIL